MLKSELAKGGYVVSERTVRRTLKRLGFRWKRAKYVLGRHDPDNESKKGRWRHTQRASSADEAATGCARRALQ